MCSLPNPHFQLCYWHRSGALALTPSECEHSGAKEATASSHEDVQWLCDHVSRCCAAGRRHNMHTSLLCYIQHSCFHTFGGIYTNVGEKEIRHVCTQVMSDHCSFLGYLYVLKWIISWMKVKARKGGEKNKPLNTKTVFGWSDPHCSQASVTTRDVNYANNLFLRGNKFVFYLKYSVVCMEYALFRPTG